jgi:hypothetical protein
VSAVLFCEDDVLQWPPPLDDAPPPPLRTLHRASTTQKNAATKLLPKVYRTPEEFAILNSPLQTLEVHAQLKQALEEVDGLGTSAMMVTPADPHRREQGEGPIRIKIAVPRASKVRSTSSPEFRVDDILLLSESPLAEGVLQALRESKTKQGDSFAHCLALVERIVQHQDDFGDDKGKHLEDDELTTTLHVQVQSLWKWDDASLCSRAVAPRSSVVDMLCGESASSPSPNHHGAQISSSGGLQKQQQSPRGKLWYVSGVMSLVTELRVAKALLGFARMQVASDNVNSVASVLATANGTSGRGQ